MSKRSGAGMLSLAVAALLLTACGGGSSSGSSSVQQPTATVQSGQSGTGVTPTTPATKPTTPITTPATPTPPTTSATTPVVQPATPTTPTTTPIAPANFEAKFPNRMGKLESNKRVPQELGVDTVKLRQATWNNQPMGDYADLNQLSVGVHKIDQVAHLSVGVKGVELPATITKKYVIYKQPNSVIVGTGISSVAIPGLSKNESEQNFAVAPMYGSPSKSLPKAGTYQYQGVSFDKAGQTGSLEYRVNFDTQTGQGKATLGGYQATLNEAKIEQSSDFSEATKHLSEGIRETGAYAFGQGYSISGTASAANQNGFYNLVFMGSQAQELAGFASLGNENFGLAATKQ